MKEFIFSVLEFLSELGYFGIALGLMIEVIPSEIVLGYGGYMISEGILGYPGAIIAGTIGGTFAQLFLYWAGYYGGRPFLEKYGKYVLIKKKQIDLSEQWFRKIWCWRYFLCPFYSCCPTCDIHSGWDCENVSNKIYSIYGSSRHSMDHSLSLFRT